jgi:mRNA interferase RelE/StbE
MKKSILVNYAVLAQKDLHSLDRSIAQRIVLKVQAYSKADDPFAEAKPLSGELQGLFRYRVGDYRVIFELRADGSITILTVLRIKHRKDVYR